jgi:glutathione S-transferase
MSDQKVILGYWGVTGLGQSLRYILSYAHVDFKDEIYTDRPKWFEDHKLNLGIPLPNLPYLIDGDFKLTESTALLKYIPKRFGKADLLGKTIEEQARVDQILGVIGDLQITFSASLREEGWEAKRAEIYGKVNDKLVALNNFV